MQHLWEVGPWNLHVLETGLSSESSVLLVTGLGMVFHGHAPFHFLWKALGSTVRRSQFLLCAREAKEPPQWALSQAWRKCEEEDIRHPPDLLCLGGGRMGVGGPTVRWFLGDSGLHGSLENLGRRAPSASEAVVAEGCEMLIDVHGGGTERQEEEVRI